MVKHRIELIAVVYGEGYAENMMASSEQPRDSLDPDKEPQNGVTDAAQNNWVDRSAPGWAQPYLRLMRADRPIGFWLLFWPCAWSLTLGSIAEGEVWLNLWFLRNLLLFLGGAIVMRGAGCVWNDITDRHIDAQVARTKLRPIPSGQVSVKSALLLMIALCLVGLLVLLQFNWFAVYLGFSSLLIVAIYPFMKRFTNWPQAVLGLAFGWGALMGWASMRDMVELPALLLYGGTICWIIGYDTIYAHQDREDDALIGMKSTALQFGEHTKKWLAVFFGLTVFLLLAASFATIGETISLLTMAVLMLGMGTAGGLLLWQLITLDIDDPDNCLDRFRQAHIFGIFVFITLVALWFAQS